MEIEAYVGLRFRTNYDYGIYDGGVGMTCEVVLATDSILWVVLGLPGSPKRENRQGVPYDDGIIKAAFSNWFKHHEGEILSPRTPDWEV